MALEAAEQIANMMVMDPYPGFDGRHVLDAVPQRAAQAAPEAAPADVDGVHEPRHDQGGGPQRHRRAGIQLRRSRRGEVVGRRLLRHHPERRVRAARPHGQREHRAGHRVLVARGSRRGDPPRTGGLRVLRLRAQCPRGARPGAGAHRPVGRVPGAPLPRQRRPAHRGGRRAGRRFASASARRTTRRAPASDARCRCRPGDLHPAGGTQRARRHLLVARAVRHAT